MKRSKLALTIIILIAITFIVQSCNSVNEKEKTTELEELVIGYPYLRIALPVIVAYHNGYFKEQGLNVTLKPYETAQPMMDAIVSGKIDLGGFCALPITFGAMARSKTPLLFLGGMYEDDAHPISLLLVKDTTNIKKIKDLKGKKIGILPTRAYEVWIEEILKANGVTPEDVIIRQVKPNLQADALYNGSVDALFTNDPAATITLSKGYGVKLTGEALVPKTTNINPFYFGSFNVRKDYADKNPEIVKKISIALDKASNLINSNPDIDSLMSLDNYLPEAFRPIVKNFPDSYFRTSNQVHNEDLKQLKEFYLDRKILPVDIEINDLQYKK